jgi:hypothetical protein
MGQSITSSARYDSRDPDGEVIFSFVDGFVWASWPGTVATVRVGGYESVTAAMRDFLAQSELGDRLANGKSANWHR